MTSPARFMNRDRERLPDDGVRVPAASPNHMERGMMRLLNKAQSDSHSSAPARVCGLQMVFSVTGDAAVTWDLRHPLADPDP